MNWYILHNITV